MYGRSPYQRSPGPRAAAAVLALVGMAAWIFGPGNSQADMTVELDLSTDAVLGAPIVPGCQATFAPDSFPAGTDHVDVVASLTADLESVEDVRMDPESGLETATVHHEGPREVHLGVRAGQAGLGDWEVLIRDDERSCRGVLTVTGGS